MQKVEQQATKQIAEEAGQTVDPCGKCKHTDHQKRENNRKMIRNEIVVLDVKQQ